MDSFKCCEKCHESREQDARAVLTKRTSYFFLIKSQHHSIPWIDVIPLCVIVGTRIIYQLQLILQQAPNNTKPHFTTEKEKRALFILILPYPLECPLPDEPDDQYAPSQSEHYTMQRMDGANPHSTFSSSIWHLTNFPLKSRQVGT